MKCHAKGFVAVAQMAFLLKWVEWVYLKLCGPHQILGIRRRSGFIGQDEIWAKRLS